MANTSKEEKKTEATPPRINRRTFLVGAGTGVAGLVVGGVGGYQIPKPKEPSLPVPTTWIGRNIANCTGCRECQIACSQIKEDKIQPGIARVQIHQYAPGIEFPVICYQCGSEAKCVENCPTQALSVDSSKGLNNIVVDTTKCLRTAKGGDCTSCQAKCPGSVVVFHPTSKAPLFCDLCNGDPACVKNCPKATIDKNGPRMAAASPDTIALGLQELYKVPPPPAKQSKLDVAVSVEDVFKSG